MVCTWIVTAVASESDVWWIRALVDSYHCVFLHYRSKRPQLSQKPPVIRRTATAIAAYPNARKSDAGGAIVLLVDFAPPQAVHEIGYHYHEVARMCGGQLP